MRKERSSRVNVRWAEICNCFDCMNFPFWARTMLKWSIYIVFQFLLTLSFSLPIKFHDAIAILKMHENWFTHLSPFTNDTFCRHCSVMKQHTIFFFFSLSISLLSIVKSQWWRCKFFFLEFIFLLFFGTQFQLICSMSPPLSLYFYYRMIV